MAISTFLRVIYDTPETEHLSIKLTYCRLATPIGFIIPY